MKKLQKLLALFLCAAMLSMAAACSSTTSVEADSYLNTFLDMLTQGDVSAYAALTGQTEEEAQSKYQAISENLTASFADTGASEVTVMAFETAYFDLLRETHYTVLGAEQNEAGYAVTLEIEPIVGLYDEMVENLRKDVLTALISGEVDENSLPDWILGKMAETVESKLDSLTYGEPQTITVQLLPTEAGYVLENEDETCAEIAALLIDTSVLQEAAVAAAEGSEPAVEAEAEQAQ